MPEPVRLRRLVAARLRPLQPLLRPLLLVAARVGGAAAVRQLKAAVVAKVVGVVDLT